MTTIVFFIVKKTIVNVNNQGKVYFTLKIQEYERAKEESKKNSVKEQNKESKDSKEESSNNNVIYVEKKNNYELDNIFKLTKIVEEKFSLDYQKVIKDFIKNNTLIDDDKRYYKLKELKDAVNDENVYELLTASNDDLDSIKDSLSKISKEIVDDFTEYNNGFNILDFSNYIETEITKVDPTIYVIVGDRNLNFDYIDDRIKTSYDDTIYKGIRIIYHNKMYDYSLS